MVLYLANVLPTLASIFIIAGFIIASVGFIICFIWVWTYSIRDHDYPLPTAFKTITIVALVCALLGSLIPSEQTIYLMAGAKGAEVAVTSDTGQEILGDIQEVIQFQLQSLKQKPLTGQ